MKNLKRNLLPFYKGIRQILHHWWPIIGLLAVISCFFWKVFILNKVALPGDFVVGVYYPWLDYKWGYVAGVPVKNPITTDVVSLIFPEQILSIDLLKQGQLPLWNRFILTGTPLFANLQAAPFSVTNFLYFLTDTLTAWNLQIILQHVFAALFMYLLLRHWKVSKLASLFGGIVYTFSGFNLIFSQWNGHTLASAFIPLIIYFEDRWLKEGRIFFGICFSLSLVFQLLSGYPQTSLYTAFLVFIYWIFLFRKKKDFYKNTVGLGVFGLFSLLLAGIQIIPAMELWGLSQRNFEPHPFEWAFLPFKKIITIVAADFFGNHATKNYWGPQDYTSNTIFIGMAGFITAIFSFSLSLLKKNRRLLFLWTALVISLILSFPTPISVFLWKHNVFGMRAASAHRATIIFCFAASGVAAIGLDYILKTKIEIKEIVKRFAIPFLLITVFGLYALSLRGYSTVGIVPTSVGLRNSILPFAAFLILLMALVVSEKTRTLKRYFGFVVIGVCLVELFYFGWKFTPFSDRVTVFPTTPVIDFLMWQKPPFRVTGNKVIPVNMRTPYRLESLEGYETIHPLRISQFLAALNSGVVGTEPVGRYGTVDNDTSRLLDLVNTKYYLTHKVDDRGNPSPIGEIPQKFNSDRFSLAFEDKSVAIMESKTVLPRAFMIYDWEVESEDEKILSLLLDEKFPLGKKIILEELPSGVSKKVSEKISSKVDYEYINLVDTKIDVSTQEDGLLFVSDAYYSGWKAYLDDKEVKIYRADFAFRAVVVPKGNHVVKFVYNSDSFYKGIAISLISFLLVLVYSLLRKKNLI